MKRQTWVKFLRVTVVCYLLVATLMATVLRELGVIPLAAHLFIFYFGMMSMVTPPVALAAYASAAIAKAKIMKTAIAAFKFSLVGFTLPFMFVYRPALLLMNQDAWKAWMDAPTSTADEVQKKNELLQHANYALPEFSDLAVALLSAIAGIVALAAAIAGYLGKPIGAFWRGLLLVSAAMLLIPEISIGGNEIGLWVNLTGGIVFLGAIVFCVFNQPRSSGPSNEGPDDKKDAAAKVEAS